MYVSIIGSSTCQCGSANHKRMPKSWYVCTLLAVLHVLYCYTNVNQHPKKRVVLCFTLCKDGPCLCAIYLHPCFVLESVIFCIEVACSSLFCDHKLYM